jgi:hypothetical protein
LTAVKADAVNAAYIAEAALAGSEKQRRRKQNEFLSS